MAPVPLEGPNAGRINNCLETSVAGTKRHPFRLLSLPFSLINQTKRLAALFGERCCFGRFRQIGGDSIGFLSMLAAIIVNHINDGLAVLAAFFVADAANIQ